MKRSPKVEILTNNAGAICAILVGADYTAEHECGIGGLRHAAGVEMPARPQGIASRTAAGPVPVSLEIKKRIAIPATRQKDTVAILRFGSFGPYHEIDYRSHLWGTDLISGAWEENRLCLVARGEAVEAVSKLAEAMQRGDFAIWMGGSGSNPFARSGVVLAIPSAIDPEKLQFMLDSDLQQNALLDDVDATGIIERIKSAQERNPGRFTKWPDKFGYHALSPGRTLGSRVGLPNPVETKHPVMFFMNPMDQKSVNFGWFTVEELDAWLEGKGPCLKSNWDKDMARAENDRILQEAKSAEIEIEPEGPRP